MSLARLFHSLLERLELKFLEGPSGFVVIFYTACLVFIFIYSIFILTNYARSPSRSPTASNRSSSNPSNTTTYNTSPSSSSSLASSDAKTLANLASSSALPSASLFLASGHNSSLLNDIISSSNDPNYLAELAKQPLPSLNMAAKSFPQDANERMRSFHERKQALIDAAKARYLRKHLQLLQQK